MAPNRTQKPRKPGVPAEEHTMHRIEEVGRGLSKESLGYFLGGWMDG